MRITYAVLILLCFIVSTKTSVAQIAPGTWYIKGNMNALTQKVNINQNLSSANEYLNTTERSYFGIGLSTGNFIKQDLAVGLTANISASPQTYRTSLNHSGSQSTNPSTYKYMDAGITLDKYFFITSKFGLAVFSELLYQRTRSSQSLDMKNELHDFKIDSWQESTSHGATINIRPALVYFVIPKLSLTLTPGRLAISNSWQQHELYRHHTERGTVLETNENYKETDTSLQFTTALENMRVGVTFYPNR